jgi:pimeloyl-ACP methyl ester carboxylesterase
VTSTASVPVLGGVVHVEEAGSGAPLVLLHGLGGDATFWMRELDALAGRFRVIALDLRGSGRTATASTEHEVEDLADDVAAVLDALGIERAHVVGFSMGGYVAQAFAVRHPERLARLVLAATSTTLNPQLRAFVDGVLAAYEAGIGPARMYDLVWPWLFSPAFIGDPAHADWFAYPEDDPLEQSLEAWRGQYLAQRRFDGSADLARIAAPTLVLLGEQDRLVAVEEAAAIAARMPDARLVVVPGAGHLVNVEEPARFDAEIVAFLTAADAGVSEPGATPSAV